MGHMPHKRELLFKWMYTCKQCDQIGPMKGRNEHFGFVQCKEANDYSKTR